jgi:hypothetical protein
MKFIFKFGLLCITGLANSACDKSLPLHECDTFASLSGAERKAVQSSERVLFQTDGVNDLVLKCLRVEPAKGGLLVAFYPAIGRQDEEVKGVAYGTKTSADGSTVELININLPFGEWQKVDVK